MTICFIMLPVGSSPLARGTWRVLGGTSAFRRLIPARAGNILITFSFSLNFSAHPRSRGEHSAVRAALMKGDGSSPLARGTFYEVIGRCLAARLIPARAGNIPANKHTSAGRQAHPRSRGEHDYAPLVADGVAGSSPLARGTSAGHLNLDAEIRLIPARAGNINFSPASVTAFTAHPRSRGEHVSALHEAYIAAGSSPLARGTCPPVLVPPVRQRLIPARAGNIRRSWGW